MASNAALLAKVPPLVFQVGAFLTALSASLNPENVFLNVVEFFGQLLLPLSFEGWGGDSTSLIQVVDIPTLAPLLLFLLAVAGHINVKSRVI